jgi:hypothetical protein
MFGPEKYGGLGNVASKVQHMTEATVRDVDEVTKKVGSYLQY